MAHSQIHIELTEDELTSLAWMLAEHRNLCYTVPEAEKCRQIFDSLAEKFGVIGSEMYQVALAEADNEGFWPLYSFVPPEALTGLDPKRPVRIELDESGKVFFGDDEEVT